MVYELLLQGVENAQTGRDLCALLHITPRDLTAAVERERRQGKPICASTGINPGYYIAPDKESMQEYCNSLKRRERALAKTRRACNKTIAKLPAREPAATAEQDEPPQQGKEPATA